MRVGEVRTLKKIQPPWCGDNSSPYGSERSQRQGREGDLELPSQKGSEQLDLLMLKGQIFILCFGYPSKRNYTR